MLLNRYMFEIIVDVKIRLYHIIYICTGGILVVQKLRIFLTVNNIQFPN